MATTLPDDDVGLAHLVPRLDAPDRLWLLPAPAAKWLASGLLSGLALAEYHEYLDHLGAAAWTQPDTLVVFVVGGLVGILGAFCRPGGRHVGQWAGTFVDYALTPRRAVWLPIGKDEA